MRMQLHGPFPVGIEGRPTVALDRPSRGVGSRHGVHSRAIRRFCDGRRVHPRRERLPQPKSGSICVHLWFPFFTSTASAGFRLNRSVDTTCVFHPSVWRRNLETPPLPNSCRERRAGASPAQPRRRARRSHDNGLAPLGRAGETSALRWCYWQVSPPLGCATLTWNAGDARENPSRSASAARARLRA